MPSRLEPGRTVELIAVAALSARTLVEAAAREGIGVVALDLFGDRDTRRAALEWRSIGEPDSLRIDAARLLPALQALARRGDVAGWIAGSGFEAQPELLAQGAHHLPLLGTAASCRRRLRDPLTFFGFLASHGIAHPEVRFGCDRGAETAGWIVKDSGGCGGWHIRRANKGDAALAAPRFYWQREMHGRSMSATFVANGSAATLLGINEQLVRALADRPFVFCGVLGPVPVSAAVERTLSAILGSVTLEFGLRGLASLDFLLDGERVLVLEVNPRPPASMALYPWLGGTGVVAAHLRACRQDELPAPPPASGLVRGSEIIFAPQALQLDAAAADALANLAFVHDLPHAGGRFAAADPVCSIQVCENDSELVKDALRRKRDAVLEILDSRHALSGRPQASALSVPAA